MAVATPALSAGGGRRITTVVGQVTYIAFGGDAEHREGGGDDLLAVIEAEDDDAAIDKARAAFLEKLAHRKGAWAHLYRVGPEPNRFVRICDVDG